MNKQECERRILKFQKVSVSLGYVYVCMCTCMLMCMFGVYVWEKKRRKYVGREMEWGIGAGKN